MTRTTVSAILATLALLPVTACSDESGEGAGIGVGRAPQIDVSEAGRSIPHQGEVATAAHSPANLLIRNVGNAPLVVRSFELESVPPGAFSIVTTPEPSQDAPINLGEDSAGHGLQILFHPDRATDVARPTAVLTIRTNQNLSGRADHQVRINATISAGRLVVQPSTVDFETVQAGQSGIKEVRLLNTGSSDLTIPRILMTGHPGFAAEIEGNIYRVTAESSSEGLFLPEPLVIGAGQSRAIDVTYRALGPEQANGRIIFRSDDPRAPEGTPLNLFANAEAPCIRVLPSRVDFGGKRVGELAVIEIEIESCGEGDDSLIIEGVSIIDDPSGVFDVDESALNLPVTLPAGQRLRVPVQYIAASVAELDSGGAFIRDEGVLRVTSTAFLSEFDVELSGFGTDGTCPVAVITVAQGDEVLPQTRLNISGSQSVASSGVINRWEWRVVQPTGSMSVFQPSNTSENVTFEPNVVGEYTFYLKVWDSFGNESCSEGEARVIATSTDDIRVELLWDTPSDPDQTDDFGSDMDLHFLHPSGLNAQGVPQYFNHPWDCYFANARPRWSSDPRSNPRLDRDDTTGAGPENINLDLAEFGRQYHVGIHYWNDWGFGTSYSTIRVFIRGSLRFQWNRVEMVQNDMWDCCIVSWPQQTIAEKNPSGAGAGNPVIIPRYR